ncbi:MAG: cbb3-type cytochrome c oxidase heme b insertion protein CcoS [Idiomarinaceae bacterium HL-53]|nr:MAG: cbb3-type cytochrome c oxidase heme b insertion protein CcoS [Idiomarinaceae bacterium HL-53]CUS48983.1 cytochrome oxidase maturation protein, cbb3-type [Idiomarinaceae bacterium HL-53]
MEALHIMVPIAIILVLVAIIVFFWAVKSGQFDDLERQGMNVLLDDEKKKQKKTSQKKTN